MIGPKLIIASSVCQVVLLTQVTLVIPTFSGLSRKSTQRDHCLDLNRYLLASEQTENEGRNLKAATSLLIAPSDDDGLISLAEKFVDLEKIIEENICSGESSQILIELARELEACSVKGADNTTRERYLRVNQVASDFIRRHVRRCFEHYEAEWQVVNRFDHIEKRLELFEQKMIEALCENQADKLPLQSLAKVKSLDCLSSDRRPLDRKQDAVLIRNALFSILGALAPDQLSKLGSKGRSAELVEALVEAHLLSPCKHLLEKTPKVLEASYLFARVLRLTDDLFPDYSYRTAELLQWAQRVSLCKRLVEATDRSKLMSNVCSLTVSKSWWWF